MNVKEEIQEEVDRIKSQLSIAHDNGDEYTYITLKERYGFYPWTDQQINEILRGLRDIDAMILSHSVRTIQKYQELTFLFKLIYN